MAPAPDDITRLPLDQLDQLGVLAAAGDPDVEIVDAALDRNADHGANTEEEMAQ